MSAAYRRPTLEMLQTHFRLGRDGVLRYSPHAKLKGQVAGTLEKGSGYYRLDMTNKATKERFRLVRHVAVYCLHHGEEVPEHDEEIHHVLGIGSPDQDHPRNLERLSRREHKGRW